ncbi:hypothetical protein BJX66DRAFT_119441 [Aspergillus keveii]|uniref:Uncharacterized protein n=1 Tax=Aspergillus keveii TaxID=714993 RepID=A0ABR4FK41_9EURO
MAELLELTRTHSILLWKMMMRLERGSSRRGRTRRGVSFEGEDSNTTIKMKRAVDQLSAQPPEGLDKAEFENWLRMVEF